MYDYILKLQALKGERLSSVFSPDGTSISASAAPHCGSLRGWATPWSAEEMLDGQHQRMDIYLCPCQKCSKWPAEKTGRGSLLNHPSCPSDDPMGLGTELNFRFCEFPVTQRNIVVAFFLIARILGENVGAFIFRLRFFFKVEISSHTLIPLFRT